MISESAQHFWEEISENVLGSGLDHGAAWDQFSLVDQSPHAHLVHPNEVTERLGSVNHVVCGRSEGRT